MKTRGVRAAAIGLVSVLVLGMRFQVTSARTESRDDEPCAPQRLVDTRQGAGLLRAAEATSVSLPAGTIAAQLNVTATAPEGDGFLTVWPCGDARPDTSTVNYHVGETSPNGITVSAAGGSVCYASNVPTHVIIDSTGAWVRP